MTSLDLYSEFLRHVAEAEREDAPVDPIVHAILAVAWAIRLSTPAGQPVPGADQLQGWVQP